MPFDRHQLVVIADFDNATAIHDDQPIGFA
jgi:hypothetical protein